MVGLITKYFTFLTPHKLPLTAHKIALPMANPTAIFSLYIIGFLWHKKTYCGITNLDRYEACMIGHCFNYQNLKNCTKDKFLPYKLVRNCAYNHGFTTHSMVFQRIQKVIKLNGIKFKVQLACAYIVLWEFKTEDGELLWKMLMHLYNIWLI